MKHKSYDFNNTNGYFILNDATYDGFSKNEIKRIINKNGLQKVAPGVYATDDIFPDDLFIISNRNKQIVISHESALYIYGLMEREPFKNEVTVKYGYNATHLKKYNVHIHTVVSDYYDIGITTHKTQLGNMVKVYDMERTICDIIKNKNRMDIQVYNFALKEYVRKKEKRLHILMDYAKKLGIERKVRDLFEVLL